MKNSFSSALVFLLVTGSNAVAAGCDPSLMMFSPAPQLPEDVHLALARALATESKQALAELMKGVPDGSVQAIQILNEIAASYQRVGRFSDALEVWNQALERMHSNPGIPLDLNAAVLNNLGAMYYMREDFAQAAPALEKAVCFYETSGASHASDLSRALFNLAAVERARAHEERAKSLYLECIRIRERSHTDDTSVESPLGGLARVYLEERELDKAEEFGRRALRAAEMSRATGAAEPLTSLNLLGRILVARGQFDEAEKLLKRAQAAASREPASLLHAETLALAGSLARARNALPQAETALGQAAALFEKVAGPQHSLTAAAWNNYSEILVAQGKRKTARPILKRSLETLERIHGSEHPLVAASLRNLAALEFSEKHYGASEALYRQCFEIDSRTLGANSPQTREDLNNLGAIESARRHPRQAEALFADALARGAGVRECGSASASLIKVNLAHLYQREKRYTEAEPLYRSAIACMERGDRSPDSLLGSELPNYSALLRVMGNYAEAEKMETRAMTIKVQSLRLKAKP